MKQMNVRAEAALLEVARRHHTTVEEVRREIRLAMAMAMCNPAPAARKIWGEIPCDGNVLTPDAPFQISDDLHFRLAAGVALINLTDNSPLVSRLA